MLELNIDVPVRKDASGAIREGQRQRLRDAMDVIFANSQELVPEDRGTLRQSGFPPEWRNGQIEAGYAARHAIPMEYGTQPFYPPLQPLLEWSERVTGDKGLGYYVAQHKIPEEGITAQPYLRPSIEKGKQWLKTHDVGEYINDEL